jgi:hypothetical protein
MDTTCKTNRFGMPLILLVGIDENNVTCLLAFGLVSHETIASFSWFLQKIKTCVGDEAWSKVSAIATDNDPAFVTPIKQLLPHAHHMLCRCVIRTIYFVSNVYMVMYDHISHTTYL